MKDDELIKLVNKQVGILEAEGFEFLQEFREEGFNVPNRVVLPNGEIYDENELRELRSTDPTNPTLLRAQMLLDLYFTAGYEEQRFSHESFMDSRDEEEARRKYLRVA